MDIKQTDIIQFQKSLLTWYNTNQRDLPWRIAKDPYHIWVSEIMLQQTKVDTVIPYYQKFLERFPTMKHLAETKEDDVLKMWEGLGYYSRARNLHQGVKEVQEVYDGIIPEEKSKIMKISGIGPYTAGAILSIAFNKALPAVDGNVMRVISRLYNLHEDISKSRTKNTIEEIAEKLIPKHHPGDFNQALMELGALICTPRTPHCLLCPVLELCEGRKKGNQDKLPIKAKKKKPKVIHRISLLFEAKHEIILVKRPSQGLLANMWELPSFESNQALSLDEWEESIYREVGLNLQLPDDWISIQHTFSHIHWDLKVFQLQFDKKHQLPDNYIWVSKDHLSELSFPKAYQAVIEQVKNKSAQLG